LANEALNGDERAYEVLVGALWPDAYRIAWSILGEPSAAEDAAQSACIAICAKLHDLSNVGAFAGWSYRIIVSHARDHARPSNCAWLWSYIISSV
jgi:RNA polymerase sigma-70 factor (ECF subfamily)